MQKCDDVLLFQRVRAVAGDDWVSSAEETVGVTEEEAEKTTARNGLEKAGDGELLEPRSGETRDVRENL